MRVRTIDPLIFQLRECFGRAAYSQKTHEKCADIYHWRLNAFKLTQIILSVLTTGSLIRVLFEQGKIAAVVAAVLATIQLFINAYAKNYDLGALSQKHSDAASKLWEIRECYLSLLTDAEKGVLDVKEIMKTRDKLQERLAAIYKGAPRTLPKGYAKAQDALKNKEDLTFSVEEIDKMLPEPLRWSKRALPSTSTENSGTRPSE